jgi:uncharacterized damage-inducible protein DinB
LDINTQKTIDSFKNIPIDLHNYSYAEGKWTIKELLIHLVDCERVFVYRALTGARGDNYSVLPSFDEDLFLENANVINRPLEDILAEFTHTRISNRLFFKSLNEEATSRSANTNGVPMSTRAFGFIIIGHSNHHLSVLKERYLV